MTIPLRPDDGTGPSVGMFWLFLAIDFVSGAVCGWILHLLALPACA